MATSAVAKEWLMMLVNLFTVRDADYCILKKDFYGFYEAMVAACYRIGPKSRLLITNVIKQVYPELSKDAYARNGFEGIRYIDHSQFTLAGEPIPNLGVPASLQSRNTIWLVFLEQKKAALPELSHSLSPRPVPVVKASPSYTGASPMATPEKTLQSVSSEPVISISPATCLVGKRMIQLLVLRDKEGYKFVFIWPHALFTLGKVSVVWDLNGFGMYLLYSFGKPVYPPPSPHVQHM